MPDVWVLAAIVMKFMLYLGVLGAAGTVFASVAFRLDRYRSLSLTFASLGLLAVIIAFSLRGAMLTGDASGMTDPKMLSLLWSTPVGTALIYCIAGLSLLIVGLYMGRVGPWLSVFGAVIAVWSFDHVGHIPDRGTTFLNLALTVHLIAIALWVGILTPLRRLAATSATWKAAADVGHRFGLVATITVPLLIIAGGYMSYQLVGSFTALVTTGYGQALMLKVVLVAVLLGLAAANKLRFIPRLRANDPSAAGHLMRSITVEWVVILAILGITAVLTSNLTLPK